MTKAATPTAPQRIPAEPNFALEKAKCEVREKLAGLVGEGNVTEQLEDLYWRAQHVLSKQGGGQLGPADLAVLCALSGAVVLPSDVKRFTNEEENPPAGGEAYDG